VKGKLISFDGKKMKGVSPKSKGNSGLYILSAWVNESRLCIGQEKVEDKSNEITAIPKLVDSIELEGSVVSIDAIACQVDIADKIVEAKADFLLSVKGNQGNLFEEISDFFNWKNVEGINDNWEYDHGRFETRTCRIKSASNMFSSEIIKKWDKVKTVIEFVSERTEKDIKSSNTRYYISSEEKSAEYYNGIVRGHWGIENHLHWHLDVTFREDGNRSRKGNAPQNLNSLRKMALQKISRMKDKLSLKKRRYRASMNPEYLYKLLGF
jgi:predicted transposase YbfD/YdcC